MSLQDERVVCEGRTGALQAQRAAYVGQGESLAGSINQKTVGQRREGAVLEG